MMMVLLLLVLPCISSACQHTCMPHMPHMPHMPYVTHVSP
jgi:hypothetical protein